jgi:hypothetical protein
MGRSPFVEVDGDHLNIPERLRCGKGGLLYYQIAELDGKK